MYFYPRFRVKIFLRNFLTSTNRYTHIQILTHVRSYTHTYSHMHRHTKFVCNTSSRKKCADEASCTHIRKKINQRYITSQAHLSIQRHHTRFKYSFLLSNHMPIKTICVDFIFCPSFVLQSYI